MTFTTRRVSIIVGKKCTLKCKLCGALAPYIKDYMPAADFLKAEIDAFFNIAYRTGTVDISGGEPFLRGSEHDFVLGDILLYLAEQYNGRFDLLRIFTNGTILPGDRLCEVFKKVSAKVRLSITVDNYGEHSAKVAEIADKLQNIGIDRIIRDYAKDVHCGGWVDLSDISHKNDMDTARCIYSKCAIPQKLGCCLELMGGIISPCSVAAARYLCGETDTDSDDIIDLFADSSLARTKLQKILSSQCFASCAYCNGGMSDDSKRFLPGEQATAKEISDFRTKHRMRF